MDKKAIARILGNMHTVNSALKNTDIPERVKEITTICSWVEKETDPKMLFAVTMTCLAQLLLDNRIILKRKINEDDKEKNEV